MKLKLLTALFAGAAMLSPVSSMADEAAEKILSTTRFATTMQVQQNLHGHMSKNGNRTPLSLFLRNENIQFSYKVKGKDNRFHMRLEEDRFDLLEIVKGKTTRFNDRKLAENINGTDVSFEDISMRFLYWKDSEVVGESKVNGRACYKLRLRNPSKTAGDYRIVDVWVDKEYGAMMKLVGYNTEGRPLKQFLVTDVMRLGKGYTLRKMRVDSINAKNNKVEGQTYIEFKKAKKAKS